MHFIWSYFMRSRVLTDKGELKQISKGKAIRPELPEKEKDFVGINKSSNLLLKPQVLTFWLNS